jgi:hypothetical protein
VDRKKETYCIELPHSVAEVQKKRAFSIHTLATLHNSTADNSYPATEETSAVHSFLIKVNRKYVAQYSKKKLNAIAFLAVVRAYERLTHHNATYTVNSLHTLTGIHAKTIVKYLLILEDIGLVDYDENHKIRLLSVKSTHAEHNIQISIEIGRKALKSAQSNLLVERFTNRLRQIDYYRTALSRVNDKRDNPKSRVTLREYKKLSRWLKAHCKYDCRTARFTEYGWAYTNIASYLGTCVTTTVEIVKKAVEIGKVVKEKVVSYRKLTSKYDVEYIPHTYIYHGYAFTVSANRYSVGAGNI